MKNAFRWYIFAVSKVEDFHGRAGRAECWSFFFFESLFLLIAGLIDYFITGFPILLPIYAVLTAIPTFLLMIRRLHDCGFSGGWVLLAILPPLCFFVMSWAPDPDQPNKYGTTERLPSKKLIPKAQPEIIDGIEYLTPPPQPYMSAKKRREQKLQKELDEIIKSEEGAAQSSKTRGSSSSTVASQKSPASSAPASSTPTALEDVSTFDNDVKG